MVVRSCEVSGKDERESTCRTFARQVADFRGTSGTFVSSFSRFSVALTIPEGKGEGVQNFVSKALSTSLLSRDTPTMCKPTKHKN